MSPSAGTPTALWDIKLLVDSYDVLEGLGLNRSDVLTQHVPILYSGTSVNPAIDESDVATLTITGNSVASAVVQIDLYYAMGE